MICNQRSLIVHNSGQSIGEIYLYSELPNPTWLIKNKIIRKLKSLWNKLIYNYKGIPAFPSNSYRGCFIRESDDSYWYCFNRFVIRKNGNIIDIKLDENKDFENAILRSIPETTYRDICNII